MNRLRFVRALVPFASALALTFTLNALGEGEHPEHPKKEHPKKEKSDKSAAKSEVSLDDIATASEKYVSEHSKDGVFSHYDKSAKKKLALTFDKVHKERLSQTKPNEYFVCADFKTADGKVYDIDFWVRGTSKDNLTIDGRSITVHKEDGKERYNWEHDEKSDTWKQKPLKAAKPASKKEGKPGKPEHPEHPMN